MTVRTKKFITNRLLQRKQFVSASALYACHILPLPVPQTTTCRLMNLSPPLSTAHPSALPPYRKRDVVTARQLAKSPAGLSCRWLRLSTRAWPASPRRT